MEKRRKRTIERTPEREEPSDSREQVVREIPLDGRDWQIAQIAATLLRDKDIDASSNASWKWADAYFRERVETAIRQSRILLQLVEAPVQQKTSLYQWFDPGKVYSVKEVRDRVVELGGWPRSGDEDTIRDTLIKPVRKGWETRIDEVRQTATDVLPEALEYRGKLRSAIQPLLNDPLANERLPNLRNAADQFLAGLIDDQTLFTDEERITIRVEREEKLLAWCFCEDHPKGRAVKVRPHELFRFAEEKSLLPPKWEPVEAFKISSPHRETLPSRILSTSTSFKDFNKVHGDSSLMSYPWFP